jgi:uncharacterized membrane protein
MIELVRLAVDTQFHLAWNLFLALVPLVLSFWLFSQRPHRWWFWWPGFLVFIAFLPNAAYTLTDVIHFIDEVRDNNPLLPEWSVVYIVIPKYVLFMLLGFQCHTISLIRLGRYLAWQGMRSFILPAELLLNFLCAIGVYWGRYLRFNSWDIVTRPQHIADHVVKSLTEEVSGRRIVTYFAVITVAYFCAKFIDLAVWDYWQRRPHAPYLTRSAKGISLTPLHHPIERESARS